MVKICRVCKSEFGLFPGKPGKIDECTGCANDIPVYWAEQGQGDDGTVETMTVKPMATRIDVIAIPASIWKEVQGESDEVF